MARPVVTNLDLLLNQLLNAKFQVLSADPGSPQEGQFWYNSTTKTLKFRTDATTITLGRLDQITAPTASVDLNNQKITSVANGTNPNDAVNFSQLQAAQTGLDVKQSVRVATQGDIDLGAPGASIDGVALSNGDRVLVKAQTNGEENGIYVWNGAASAMTRATDADSSAEVNAGMFTFVEEGTVDADTGWVLSTNNPITLDTTELVFTKFSSTGAGTGTVNKYAEDIGDGVETTINVAHGLGTSDVVVSVYDNASDEEVIADVDIVNANTVAIGFSVAPTSDQYRVVVLG